jgi:hypothetical protein
VTAFAQGDGIGVAADGGAAIEMDAVNTIAFGGSADVRASAGAGSSATVTLSSSNYSSAEPEGAGDASITAVGSGSNQTAEPIFVGAGDFRQASGSPTIDAGELDPQLGPSDLGGEPRMQGSGPDIGADEFPLFGLQEGSPPDDGGGGPNQGGGGGPGGGGPGAGSGSGGPRGTADRRAPNTRITKHPRKRVRRKSDRVRAAFRFVATERRSTFQCKLDRKRWRRCRAPYRAALRATRKPKSHIFRVRATDRAGNTDPSPARFRWKVKRRR